MTASPSSLAKKIAFFCIWFFVFSLPWEDSIVFGHFGTVSRLVGLPVFVTCSWALIESGQIRRLSPLHVLVFLHVAWECLTTLWTLDPTYSATLVVTYLQLTTVMCLIWNVATSDRQQRTLTEAFVLGTFVSIASTVFNYLRGQAMDYQRYAAAGFNADDLGLTLAVSIPLSYWLSIESENPLLRWVYRLQPLAAIGAIAIMATRASFAAAILASGAVVIATLRYVGRTQKLGLALCVVLGTAVALRFVPKSSWERLSTIGSEMNSGTFGDRKQIWRAGMDMFVEHPLFGIGAGAFAPRVELRIGIRKVAHNTFISVLVEGGIIGLTIFLVLMFGIVRCILSLPTLRSRVLLIAFSTWALVACTLTFEYRKPTWFLYTLVAGLTGSMPPLQRSRSLAAVPTAVPWRPTVA